MIPRTITHKRVLHVTALVACAARFDGYTDEIQRCFTSSRYPHINKVKYVQSGIAKKENNLRAVLRLCATFARYSHETYKHNIVPTDPPKSMIGLDT